MKDSLVDRREHGPIVVLTMNRPDKRNALSRQLVAELSDALYRVASSPTVRAVVLTGAGPVFCAGMDLKEAAVLGGSDEGDKQAVADAQALSDLIDQIHFLERPTIAALNGDALAGGAGIAVACDFIVASDTARIGYPEIKRGLVAAIVMHDLACQLGDRRARELLLTGRTLGAREADAWGLVNRVVPAERCLDEAMALATSLFESAPRAIASTKRLLDEACHRPQSLRGPAAISAATRLGDEAVEGIASFLEKRKPSWCEPKPSG